MQKGSCWLEQGSFTSSHFYMKSYSRGKCFFSRDKLPDLYNHNYSDLRWAYEQQRKNRLSRSYVYVYVRSNNYVETVIDLRASVTDNPGKNTKLVETVDQLIFMKDSEGIEDNILTWMQRLLNTIFKMWLLSWVRWEFCHYSIHMGVNCGAKVCLVAQSFTQDWNYHKCRSWGNLYY